MMRNLRDYLLSLPERAVRSASAVSGGLLKEIGEVVLPAPLRRTRLYRTMVDSTLRFLIEQVGEVEGVFPEEGRLGADFALRRAAGNGLEIIGLLTMRASPVWVMAALADLSGAGRGIVHEIAETLKKEGLLDPETEFETVDRILDGLESTSGKLADTINTPPLDAETLRRDWEEIRANLSKLPPSLLPSTDRLAGQWRDLRNVADEQGRGVFEISSALALSALASVPEGALWVSRSAILAARRTGEVVASPLLDHYTKSIGEIRKAGFLSFWNGQFRPYLRAAAEQFTKQEATLTLRWVKKFRGEEPAEAAPVPREDPDRA